MTEAKDISTISEQYVAECIKKSPELATSLGIHENDSEMDDNSYQSKYEELSFIEHYLNLLEQISPETPADEISRKVLKHDLLQEKKFLEKDLSYYAEGVFNSIVTSFFEIFDLMKYETSEDYIKLSKRLLNMVRVVENYQENYLYLNNSNIKNSNYNLTSLIAQYKLISEEKRITKYVNNLLSNVEIESKVKNELLSNAQKLEDKIGLLAVFLEDEILPSSKTSLGVGKDIYQKFANYYTYEGIDLEELYNYGLSELNRINTLIDTTFKEILPDYSSKNEVINYLNEHPNYLISSKKELLSKLRAISDDATANLNGKYFDIPKELLNIDIKLNDESLDASPYYIPPSEDLTRAGSAWFPTLGKDKFTIWPQVSTWYHEAVPGHHLQCGLQLLNKERLTRYQTTLAWHSGYGEGWALYSETLMYNLGYFADPGYRVGYLQSQALRAARIVIDLGLHLDLPSPEDNLPWTVERAVNFMVENAILDADYALSEVNRYLASPGQAISYKVGERVWNQLYTLAEKEIEDFQAKEFHQYALSLGSMRLDDFQREILQWISTKTS